MRQNNGDGPQTNGLCLTAARTAMHKLWIDPQGAFRNGLGSMVTRLRACSLPDGFECRVCCSLSSYLDFHVPLNREAFGESI